MDRPGTRISVSVTHRVGLAWNEDKLSSVRGPDRSGEFQLPYWNDAHGRSLSIIAATLVARVSGVHRNCFTFPKSPALGCDHTRRPADDFPSLRLFLGPPRSLIGRLLD